MSDLNDAIVQAYVGEAKAALRLRVYAQRAAQEGYPQIARLFLAVALSEEFHGGRMLRLVQQVGGTEENLQASFEKETGVAEVAYDAFIRQAQAAGDEKAARIFTHCRDVEANHAALYRAAMDHALDARDVPYHVCMTCGYVAEGEAPEACPVCGVKKEKFVAV